MRVPCLQYTLVSGALALLAACSSPTPQVPRQRRQLPPQNNVVNGAVEATIYDNVDTGGINPLTLGGKDAPGYVNPYPEGSYEHFVAKPKYPGTMENYCNERLLQQMTVVNSKIIVCIPQQRARLYVNGKVAYDWPVSTGSNGHETPTGVFRILDRETNHHSNRYGKYINSSGKTVNSNADTSKGIPDGVKFSPASMPHWNRLTWDGVGIHGGKVVPGKRLSHGCIRTPYDVARKLFQYTRKDLPVYVSRAVEDYNRGGAVRPIDVKYRPKPGNDYTDMAPEQYKRTDA